MKLNLESASWVIPAISLIVTVDQWIAATGAADPFQVDIVGKPFSVMAGARGIAIVLAVTYALQKLRVLQENRAGAKLFSVLVGCVVVMLATETIVITPYTMSAMTQTEIAKVLIAIHPMAYGLWAMFVSAISLLAVVTAALSSLVTPNQIKAIAPKKSAAVVDKIKIEPGVISVTPEIQPEQIAKVDKPLSRPEQLKQQRGIK